MSTSLKHAFSRFFSIILSISFILSTASCNSGKKDSQKLVAIIDAIEDATMTQARLGFIEGLASKGWSEQEGNLKIIQRNAQGDVPTLIQSLQYFKANEPDLIVANSTLSMISSVKYIDNIPICMMVGPEPWRSNISTGPDDIPKNLFGVYESLDYLDTSFTIITDWLPTCKKVGVIYNQAETQSLNALERLQEIAANKGVELVNAPVTNSSETQLVANALLNQNIDAFFALPDNIIFSSFEVILKACNRKNIPIFTSEAGLVDRGAVAAYGAGFYEWGYQAGEVSGTWLTKDTKELPPLELVKIRKKVYNPTAVDNFGFIPDDSFVKINF